MKKILALAAVAALTAGVSAYAANPFSDVSTDDWAYQAVSDLSDQGVVEGYPDGTFKGERNMTRYELAQIIARLMAKEDQMNAEQQATLDKLAGEYADELANLGVRVANLEKKVGNISWYGDARMRYQHDGTKTKYNKKFGVNDTVKDQDAWKGRIRINAKADVNENTYVRGRLTSGNVDLKGNGDADVKMDRIIVHHQFSDNVGLTLGRYDVGFGQQVTWLYGNGFDGAEAQFNFDKVNVQAGFGHFSDGPSTQAASGEYDDNGKAKTLAGTGLEDQDTFYAKAQADLQVAKLGLDYYKTNTSYEAQQTEVYGVNLLVPVGDFRVFGDYYKDNDGAKASIWTAGLGYGALNLKQPGSFALDVAYFDVEKGLYRSGMTGLQVAEDYLNQDGSFFLATGDVALQKNVSLHAEYAFGHDADKAAEGDLGDSYTFSLNYKF